MGAAATVMHEGQHGFPRVEKYLARLPEGIDSHPSCMARASLYRTFADAQSLRGMDWAALPPRVSEMLRAPLQPNEWTSEVATAATVLALADHLDLHGDALDRWFYSCSARLFSSSTYAPLMSLVSPALLVKHGEARWAHMHRGCGFGVTLREGGADATVRYPPFLFSDEIVRAHGEGVRAALTLSRAKDCTVQIERTTPRSCTYRFDWRS